jgi:HK97 family phage major capsid protein
MNELNKKNEIEKNKSDCEDVTKQPIMENESDVKQETLHTKEKKEDGLSKGDAELGLVHKEMEKPEKFERIFHFNLEKKQKPFDEKSRTVDIAFSSEEPYQRSFGMEILSHKQEDVDMEFFNGGSAPLLLDHDSTKQIGIIEKADISEYDKMGRATVRFGKSSLAEEVFNDVLDGIRKNISVGYEVTNMVKMKENKGDGTPDNFRVSWRPLEVSSVSVPADTSVGVGRSRHNINPVLSNEGKDNNYKEKTMIEKIENPKVEETKVDVKTITDNARKDEYARIKEITAIGGKHNCRDLADKSIQAGDSVAEFRSRVLDHIGTAKPLEQKDIGLSEKESRGYSIVRAIKAMTSGNWSDAQLEKEASDEVARKTGRTPRGVFVPSDVRWTRDLIQGVSADGGALVATNLLSGSFIEALRARMVVKQAGALFLSGLVGEVAIPAQLAVNSASWVAENAAVTEVNTTYRQVTMSPKTLGTFTDISRHLIHQSTPAIETIVRNDIIKSLSNEVDKQAIQGSGSSNKPTGILNTSGIGSVAIDTNGGAFTWAKAVETWKEVATDNADIGALAWVTSPLAVSRLMATAKVGSSDSVMIMNDQNKLLGYNVFSTTNSPDTLTKGSSSGDCSALTFGNFNDLIVGEWGNLDINVDPYTNSSKGGTRIIGLYDVDVAVRHAESFAAIQDNNA